MQNSSVAHRGLKLKHIHKNEGKKDESWSYDKQKLNMDKFETIMFAILQVCLILLVCLICMAMAMPEPHRPHRRRNRNRGGRIIV